MKWLTSGRDMLQRTAANHSNSWVRGVAVINLMTLSSPIVFVVAVWSSSITTTETHNAGFFLLQMHTMSDLPTCLLIMSAGSTRDKLAILCLINFLPLIYISKRERHAIEDQAYPGKEALLKGDHMCPSGVYP